MKHKGCEVNMSYTVQSSERVRKSGADAETKAMLYLMNFRDDSNEMNYFVVDFFNDVTGMDRMARKLWDVQSKASKTGSAKTIGRELVTLYKNYICQFDFEAYILFVGGVPDTFRINSNLNVFGIDNVTPKAQKSIQTGVMEECKTKEYMKKENVTEDKISAFLEKVWFVIDDKNPQDYIREIVKQHPTIIPSDSELLAIFNEIRNKQAEKKNTLVEGVVIDQIDEVLEYGRHLTTNEIRLLVLQRIINTDPLSKGIPEPFMEIYSKYPPERRGVMVEECKSSLCRALFNKSAAQGFWTLFDRVYSLIMQYSNKTVGYIYHEISSDIIEDCPDFDALSLKYFIAKIKEGVLQ